MATRYRVDLVRWAMTEVEAESEDAAVAQAREKLGLGDEWDVDNVEVIDGRRQLRRPGAGTEEWSGHLHTDERRAVSEAVDRGDVRIQYRGRMFTVAEWEREHEGKRLPWGWDYIYNRQIYDNLETVLDQIDEDMQR
jgi:hypothetical protein